MPRIATTALVVVAVLAGCAGKPAAARQPPPVPAAALDTALLSAGDVDTVMATPMTAYPVTTEMADHRDLLRNRSCLAIWQPTEAVSYDGTGWTAVRRQVLRAPDSDDWTDRVVQSVVSFPTPAAARAFFSESADRWSKCTNHRLNITINDQPQPAWRSGDLNRADSRITIGVTRGDGDRVRSCQRVLVVDNNVVIDADACSAQQGGQAGGIVEKIVEKIKARLPR